MVGNHPLAKGVHAGQFKPERGSVAVTVMDVRVVRMCVNEFLVPVPVGVRFTLRVIRAVRVMVVFIVRVQMLVLHRFVMVIVFVTFGEVQPDAASHQNGGDTKLNRQLVAQE